MIRVLVGDLFESDAQTLVNTVNCVGVMGKGIALGFRQRYPEMYEDYVARCVRKQVHLGEPYLYRQLFPPNILNFPTKNHWRSVSNLADIVAGLEYLLQHYQEWGMTSLAVPPLGCGEGQLEWRVVGPTLWRYLARLTIPVELYAPVGTPASELDASFLGAEAIKDSQLPSTPDQFRVDPAWVALIETLARIEREYYHWPVGRTRFQKLAYFATMLGIPTKLQFQRGSYGPYAPEGKAIITKLVNNGLLREDSWGSMLMLKLGPTYQDAVRNGVYEEAIRKWDVQIDRVADLLLRLSTNDTEVAASVHFAWISLARGSDRMVPEAELLAEVREWKQKRRPPLDEATIRQSIRELHMLGWIRVQFDDASMLSENDPVFVA